MKPRLARLLRATVAPALICMLTACGGGSDGTGTETEAAVASASGAAVQANPAGAAGVEATAFMRRSALAATAPSNGPDTEIVVRAYATLAGNVGPLMQLRVDGVVVQTREIRALEATDHRFTIPALRPGSKVDVVYTNDGNVNGADRNLYVLNLVSAATYVLPTSPGVVLDRGTGAAAFDGLDVLPGQTPLYSNGALRFTWPAANMPDRLTVSASGTLAGNTGPVLQLRVAGITVGSVEVRAADATEYTFNVPTLASGSKIDVVYANDASSGGEDRNLTIDYLIAGSTYMRPGASGVVYDLGSGMAAFDGVNTLPGQTRMTSNGALRFKWAAANITSSVTVRASGVLAGGIGPQMALRVDGVVFGSVEVRSTEPADHVFAVPRLAAGNQVDVIYTNHGQVNGNERSLNVAYLIAGTTVVRPTDAGVVFDAGNGAAAFDGVDTQPGRNTLAANGALRTMWPQPNLTSSLNVRAHAMVAGNVGAVMALRVDGVVVGSTEVRATEPADHLFAVPPLLPGSRVDVVFTNDGKVDGVDRNLYVSYLIAGSTSVLPNAPGVVYDRGAGAAAYDDIDTLPGQGTMAWSGALQVPWPSPNVTSTVTVRASGVLAGNIGPLMQVRVDGVTVATLEVRNTQPADIAVAVPMLRPGSKVDVAYINDGTVDGTDRKLTVAYLQAGNTFVQSADPGVVFDHGAGAAAYDGINTTPGRSALEADGALRMTWPVPNVTDNITVRASATLAGNVGALMQLRVNGVILGTAEVRSAEAADYVFAAPAPVAGSRIDVVYLNDATINGADRNLFVYYVKAGASVLSSSAPGVLLDTGGGETAFDGVDTASGSGAINRNGALRFTLPAAAAADTSLPARFAAARLLQQATFGATTKDIDRVVAIGASAWLNEQMALPYSADYVSHIQAKYDLGPDYRPGGSKSDPNWLAQRFWATAATAPDQLRRRVAFSLHQMLTASMADSNVWNHARAYANHLDMLHRGAFGNYRSLLEDVAMSPSMGIYLSHMRNRKEDPVVGRLPDENFARELMQLFSIGLHELNIDGSVRLNAGGKPIETYTNSDVMAMAKVFTGRSWAFPDNQLTENFFLRGNPDYSAAGDQRIDLLPMKIYPGQHSTAEKRLFAGKPQAVVIPADTPPADSLRIALDTLFMHPNVGPFVGRQLIQRLVTSAPSPAYVARVASVFNNNGQGVRGDMAAVVRAVLLDSEARSDTPPVTFGKLGEPVLRVAQWMRAFGATSASGSYLMVADLDNLSQRALSPASVFGYTRPGYVPPNTAFAGRGAAAPEFQIVNESTTAAWVNKAEAMAGSGLGWTVNGFDVSSPYTTLAALAAAGNIAGMQEHLNLLLFAGRMSAELRQAVLDGVAGVTGTDAASHLNRARAAVFIALASPEFIAQR